MMQSAIFHSDDIVHPIFEELEKFLVGNHAILDDFRKACDPLLFWQGLECPEYQGEPVTVGKTHQPYFCRGDD